MFTSRPRTWVTTLALGAGVALGAAGIADAASNGSTATTTSGSAGTSVPHRSGAPAGNPAAMPHGPGETLLTGSAASKARAAALASVPGATVVRVETDSAGAAYEAHLKKADGSYVTVKMDKAFKVTATESGFGAGPPPGANAGPGR
jgi:hypothetical protein